MPIPPGVIGDVNFETTSPQFVRATAARLVTARGRRLRTWLAWRSGGRFSRRDLADAETGLRALDLSTVTALAELYGLRLADVLPSGRAPMAIRAEGLLMASGRAESFTPGNGASLVCAYLRMVHEARDGVLGPGMARDEEAAMIARHLDSWRCGPLQFNDVLAASDDATDDATDGPWPRDRPTVDEMHLVVDAVQRHRLGARPAPGRRTLKS